MKYILKPIIFFIGILGLIFSVMPNNAISEETTQLPLSFAGQWPYHPSKGIAVDVKRDLVFLGDGERIDILDTDFNHISSFTVTQSGIIRGLFYSDLNSALYVACFDDGLKIIDMSDPINPFIIGEYLPEVSYTQINGVFVQGNRTYLAAGYRDGLIILNSADTSNMILLSQSVLPGGFGQSYAVDVIASGDFAYVADIFNGTHIVDVSDPAAPSYDKGIPLPGRDMVLENNYLYTTLEGNGMAITDMATPTDPTIDSIFDADGIETSVRVSDMLAYIGYGVYGLRVLDITDSTNPIHDPDWIYTDSGCTSISLLADESNILITNDQVGLEKIDVSNSSAMKSVLAYDTPADAIAIDISGGYGFMVDNNTGISPETEGLRIIELLPFQNTVTLSLKGFCATPGSASDVIVSGDFAYIADGDMGLQIIDIADKSAPVINGACGTPGIASGVFVTGNVALVADGEMGLAVVDLTDKTMPNLIGRIDTPGKANNVTASGNFAFVTDSSVGLQIIDITDKTLPVIIATCETPGIASGVFTDGDFAFIADGDMGMTVVDITDKTAPRKIVSVNTPGFAENISVIGDNAYIADGKQGVCVINVAIPSQPVRMDNLSYDSTGYAADISNVFASEDEGLFTFIADGPAGLIALNIAWNSTDENNGSGNGSGGCFIQSMHAGKF